MAGEKYGTVNTNEFCGSLILVRAGMQVFKARVGPFYGLAKRQLGFKPPALILSLPIPTLSSDS